VDKNFALHAFEFSLDPGTGPVEVRGRIDGRRLSLDVTTPSGTRSEVRELDEPPALSLNISRRLANGGLIVGARYQWTIFDPATLRNSKVNVEVGKRELVRGAGAAPIPAFRVEMESRRARHRGLPTPVWCAEPRSGDTRASPLTARERWHLCRMRVDARASPSSRGCGRRHRAARRADADPPRQRGACRPPIWTAGRSA
jgi:hypothetical protein